ncbi:MAG: ABC transporter ATP-binding protein, partial [Niameybacter sp.]
MENLLELNGVSKHYGNKEALKGIDLKIAPGKVIGLLGPNGSGKSTMIKLINGLLQPTQGEILVAGKRVGLETKQLISYLPERTYLNDWMKVKDLVAFFADFYEDFDKEKAQEMLQTLNIDTDSKLKTLSKGNKEKVQLILVMSRKAKLY